MDSNIEMFRKVDCQITKDDLIAIKVQQLEEEIVSQIQAGKL